MSTINVDNIAEYTSSGKINATHDIKMASGKSVLNSDGKATGALVLLASEEMSSTSAVEFYTATTGWTKTKYNAFKIVCSNIKMSSDGARIYCGFYGGSTQRTGTFESGGYQSRIDSSSGAYYGGLNFTDYLELIPFGIGNSTREGATIEATIYPSDGTTATAGFGQGIMEGTSGNVYLNTYGYHIDGTSSIDGARIYASTGSMTSGHISFYGISK